MAADGAGAAPAPQPPTLLSLPNETLANLFALLSGQPGVVSFTYGSRDAHALAAAHPRLDRLFRHELVTRLEFDVSVLMTRSSTSVNAMQRWLQRFTHATAIDLFNTASLSFEATDASRRFHEVAAYASPRLTVVNLVSVKELCGSDVRALLARCRGLEELRFLQCSLSLEDRDLFEIVAAAGPRLRELSLHNSVRDVPDASGARLRDLTALTHLNLYGCSGVGPATLLAVAALPALAYLCVAHTKFSAEDAIAALPRMRALHNLDVTGCDAVGPWLWAALPPTLRGLRADDTALLQGAPGEPCAAALAELHARGTGDRRISWAALAGSHTRALRKLSLGDSQISDLEHASADAALQGMPHLESLDVGYSREVGDGTATAVARHPALRFVDFRGTSISPTGVHALRRWEGDGNPTAVRGEPTTAGRSRCKRRAVIAKRRALLDA